jgi:glutamyl/glutaminyl-tRNA synthetase
VRFRNPDSGSVVVDDVVHGPIVFDSGELDDLIIARSDGTPTYNFCVVVDDYDMRITHVIRGDDHLSNTPRQILLAKALGAASPRFAHLPLLVAPGGAPLSKREGAVSLRALREAGYPPEAVLNHLALLGWSPPSGVEVLTREELVAAFDLARVSRSPAVFDRVKLDALSQRHLTRWEPARLTAEAVPVLQEAGLLPARLSPEVMEWAEPLVGLVSDRLSRFGEIPGLLSVVFGFDAAAALEDPDVRGTLADPAGRKVVTETLALWPQEPISAPRLQALIAEVRRRTGAKGRDLFHPIRVGLTGFGSGPELVRLLPVLDAGGRLDLPRPVRGCGERARRLLAAVGET